MQTKNVQARYTDSRSVVTVRYYKVLSKWGGGEVDQRWQEI